ncbi:hypothetical protein DIZ76_012993 [Coccidioides immitis]|nr:hypothetical protein DIZ76_012993 [Coccidioides immitis]
MVPARAHHRHHASLEKIINFSAPEPLTADQRSQARDRFYAVINHFSATDRRVGYSRPLLVRYTFEYARSELSQDIFLRAFFEFMNLGLTSDDDIDFDDDQLDNVKASGHHTAQPSPAHLSVIHRAQGGIHEFTATPDRLSVLRGICLIRDRNRCVISRIFDQDEAISRLERHGNNARDDDGQLLLGEEFLTLEVAHILPHALTQAKADSQLDDSKKAALMILNMFDFNVSHLINGVDIDRPFNAISLTQNLHGLFGKFKIFFEPVPGQEHTYRIDSCLPPGAVRAVPVTRTLYLTPDRSIEPPLPRLLAIHSAICHILQLSGAGQYIDKILQDLEEIGTREDGSTDLGRLVNLRLGGWLDGAVDVH